MSNSLQDALRDGLKGLSLAELGALETAAKNEGEPSEREKRVLEKLSGSVEKFAKL